MNNDIRWKQRFQNFENTFHMFQRRIDENKKYPDQEAYQMALVQGFEMIQELSWKVLKDYLENEGYQDVSNSKKAFRTAFQEEIITSDVEIWMQSIEKRNITSHTYDKDSLREIVLFITDFYPAVRDLYQKLKAEI